MFQGRCLYPAPGLKSIPPHRYVNHTDEHEDRQDLSNRKGGVRGRHLPRKSQSVLNHGYAKTLINAEERQNAKQKEKGDLRESSPLGWGFKSQRPEHARLHLS